MNSVLYSTTDPDTGKQVSGILLRPLYDPSIKTYQPPLYEVLVGNEKKIGYLYEDRLNLIPKTSTKWTLYRLQKFTLKK